MDIFYHTNENESEKDKNVTFWMCTIMVKYKAEVIFEYFDAVGQDKKEARKKVYISFLMNTKLPLPDDLTKESKLKKNISIKN